MKPPHPTEHQEQVALFKWSAWSQNRYPELALMFAIPNSTPANDAAGIGAVLHQKAEGLKSGVPDIFLPVSRRNWHGLFLEMKAVGGRARPEQWAWIEQLELQGYRAVVVRGFEEARAAIEEYLSR